MVIVENYPDLKSSENFLNLQTELAGTENRIAVARRDRIVAEYEYAKVLSEQKRAEEEYKKANEPKQEKKEK